MKTAGTWKSNHILKQITIVPLLALLLLSSCAAAPFLVPVAIEFARNLFQTGLQNYGSKHRDNLSNLVNRLSSPYTQGLPPMMMGPGMPGQPGIPGQPGFFNQPGMLGQPGAIMQPGFPNQSGTQTYSGQQVSPPQAGSSDPNNPYSNNQYGSPTTPYPGTPAGTPGYGNPATAYPGAPTGTPGYSSPANPYPGAPTGATAYPGATTYPGSVPNPYAGQGVPVQPGMNTYDPSNPYGTPNPYGSPNPYGGQGLPVQPGINPYDPSNPYGTPNGYGSTSPYGMNNTYGAQSNPYPNQPYGSTPYGSPNPYGTQPPYGSTSPYGMNNPYGAQSNPYPSQPYGSIPYGSPNPYGTQPPYGSTSPYGMNNPYGAQSSPYPTQPYGSTPNGSPNPYGNQNQYGATYGNQTNPYGSSTPYGMQQQMAGTQPYGNAPYGSAGLYPRGIEKEAVAVDVALVRQKQTEKGKEIVLMNDGDVLVDGTKERAGDRFKLIVRTNCDCYLYIISIDGSGWAEPVYPKKDSESQNPVKMDREYAFPEGPYWFSLDQVKGIETFFVVASANRRSDLEESMAQFSAEKRPATPIVAKVEEPPVIPQGVASVSTRGIITVKDETGTETQLAPSSYAAGQAGQDVTVTRWFRHE